MSLSSFGVVCSALDLELLGPMRSMSNELMANQHTRLSKSRERPLSLATSSGLEKERRPHLPPRP
jgi:hypothetical protein